MSQADPNVDLAIRERQLETHLLHSHEYRERAGQRLKLFGLVTVVALILIFGEGVFYLRQSSPASPMVMGSIDLTSLVLFTSLFLLLRTWRCLSRLNERWLTPEARNTLEALRSEQAKLHSGGT